MPRDDGVSSVTVREARPGDAAVIAGFVDLLASLDGGRSPCTPAFAVEHLARENTTVLLAELDGVAVGLLSYSLSSSLYHAGPGAMIEELAVRPSARRQGVADALMAEALRRFRNAGCKEASVSTGLENDAAGALYRKHGFVDEALLLERHFT